jgi:hypothetical protein
MLVPLAQDLETPAVSFNTLSRYLPKYVFSFLSCIRQCMIITLNSSTFHVLTLYILPASTFFLANIYSTNLDLCTPTEGVKFG